MEPEELAGLFGPYIVPTRETINTTALQVIGAGGEVLEGIHRSRRVDYASDPEELTAMRKEPIGTRWTCSCGEPGVAVDLPPEAFPAPVVPPGFHGTGVRPKGTISLCIRCDGLHLMPRFGEEVNT